MLWVEQPVGTSFSGGQVRAKSEYDIAYDFIDFFMNFQTTFGIENFKIYMTGKSYAGRYVPYIPSVMLDRHNTTYYNISRTLMHSCLSRIFPKTLAFLEKWQRGVKMKR